MNLALRLAVAAVVLPLASCACANSTSNSDTFRCRDGSKLTVIRHDGGARALVGKRSYDLRQKPSNLGERFVSSEATLIIDGEFATFVTADLRSLGGCKVITSGAAAR